MLSVASFPVRTMTRGLRLLRPALLAEMTLDTVAGMVDCPPELWRMSKDDRLVAVRMIRAKVRKPLRLAKRAIRHRRTLASRRAPIS